MGGFTGQFSIGTSFLILSNERYGRPRPQGVQLTFQVIKKVRGSGLTTLFSRQAKQSGTQAQGLIKYSYANKPISRRVTGQCNARQFNWPPRHLCTFRKKTVRPLLLKSTSSYHHQQTHQFDEFLPRLQEVRIHSLDLAWLAQIHK